MLDDSEAAISAAAEQSAHPDRRLKLRSAAAAPIGMRAMIGRFSLEIWPLDRSPGNQASCPGLGIAADIWRGFHACRAAHTRSTSLRPSSFRLSSILRL